MEKAENNLRRELRRRVSDTGGTEGVSGKARGLLQEAVDVAATVQASFNADSRLFDADARQFDAN
jgi:hypothetical protein